MKGLSLRYQKISYSHNHSKSIVFFLELIWCFLWISECYPSIHSTFFCCQAEMWCLIRPKWPSLCYLGGYTATHLWWIHTRKLLQYLSVPEISDVIFHRFNDPKWYCTFSLVNNWYMSDKANRAGRFLFHDSSGCCIRSQVLTTLNQLKKYVFSTSSSKSYVPHRKEN